MPNSEEIFNLQQPATSQVERHLLSNPNEMTQTQHMLLKLFMLFEFSL